MHKLSVVGHLLGVNAQGAHQHPKTGSNDNWDCVLSTNIFKDWEMHGAHEGFKAEAKR